MDNSDFRISDIVDLNELKSLFEDLFVATGFTIELADYVSNTILFSAGWRDICAKFHRPIPASGQRCEASSKRIAANLSHPGEIYVNFCENGLVHGCTPIIVEGRHLATLYTGQILFAPPDKDFFRQQAKTFGYDEASYLAALEQVPIIEEAKFAAMLKYLAGFATMLVKIGLERRQNEIVSKKAATQKALLDALINSIPDLIFYKDQKSVYLGCNKAFTEYAGRDEQALIGYTDFDFFPPEVAEFFQAKDRAMLASCIAQRNDEWITYPDGHRVLLDTLKTPFIGPNGEVLGLIGISRDITRMKAVEEELARKHKTLRMLADNLPDMLWAKDVQGRFLFANRAICENLLMAADVDEPIGKTELFFARRERSRHPEQNDWHTFGELCVDSDAVTLQQMRAMHFEEFGHVRGQMLYLEVNKAPLFDNDGKLLGTVGSGRDITKIKKLEMELATERKQAEKEQQRMEEQLQRGQKMEAIGMMARGVAHDLNNILSGIVAYPELILMQLPESSPLRAFALAIQESGRQAAAVVADLLTVSRGAAAVKEVCDLNRLVKKLLQSSDLQLLSASHSGVLLTADLADDLFNVCCSSTQIHKCLLNLIRNGYEAIGEEGKIIITTRNRYIDLPLKGYADVNPGEYVVLSVTDTGAGISESDLGHIFEPFYTKKSMGKRGTGLGLTVVWNVVQDHDGYIDVHTDQNGTCFDLYFPATRILESRDQNAATAEYPSGHGETILVIDDEAAQLEIATAFLTTLGYQTKTAASGEEAVIYLQNHTVDLVLLDMIMSPGMNGRETYEQILAIRPGQKAIIASGFTQTDEVRRAQELGAGRFIAKPYSLSLLSRAVKEALSEPV